MLELSPVNAVLIRCFGERSALDSFHAIPGVASCRVSEDELIVLGPPAMKQSILELTTSFLNATDPDGFVIEHTDAWSFWEIRGEGARSAFARLSANALPTTSPAFVQGAIVRLPGKALVFSDRILMMVPSTLGHHLAERVLSACADLHARQSASLPFVIESGFVIAGRLSRTT